jgi:hypothetical protein
LIEKIISVSLVLTDLYCSYAEFINNGGRVVVCGVCLGIAGYEAIDTINGTIIATPEVTSKVLTNTIVIDQAKTNKNLQSYIQKATRRYERCHTK